MPTHRTLPPTSLRLDVENPRHDQTKDQRDAIQTIAREQGEKLLNLARDIVESGLDPTQNFLVLGVTEAGAVGKETFIVLEGNRRLAALKLLEVPSLLPSDAAPSIVHGFKELTKKYTAPIGVPSVVFSTREEARHWLELRHTGQNDGVGVVDWGAAEQARFNAQLGKRFFALQAVDFLRQSGGLNPSQIASLSAIPITSLQRLLSDPAIRARLGISLSKGTITTHLPAAEVAKGLRRAAFDMASGRINVNDIRNKGDRETYLKTFGPKDLPDPGAKPGAVQPLAAAPGPPATPASNAPSPAPAPGKGAKLAPPRKTLVPKSCKINIPQARINAIFLEMRKIEPDLYPNASAILLRVFLELSVDELLVTKKLPATQWDKLSKKVTEAKKYLATLPGVTKLDLNPVQAALTPDQLFSIDTLHGFIHNSKFHPSADDLRRIWDQMQRFAELLWLP
jgi:hypothetical protein